MYRNNNGFTLVELSIVIIIIGITTSAVVIGRDVIRQSKVNNTILEVGQFKSAIELFNLEYGALPGDVENFSSYFSTCAASSAANCNGNGDGMINQFDEDYVVWEHLSLAGLIKHNGLVRGTAYIIGTNVPQSPIPTVGYWLFSYNPATHLMQMGSKRADTGFINGEAFTSEESYLTDVKIDDGKPSVGKYRAARDQEKWNDPTLCIDISDADSNNHTYLFTDTSISCSGILFF